MPYIITTKHADDRRCNCYVPAFEGRGQHSPTCLSAQESRRAVATLEEARLAVLQACEAQGSLQIAAETAGRARWAGGTVGPLPDGTIIEVSHAPLSSPFADAQAWCDIYNRTHAHAR